MMNDSAPVRRRRPRGFRIPGSGRQTRFLEKTYHLNCQLTRSAWERLTDLAGRLLASKADTLCGMIEAAKLEDIHLPPLQRPSVGQEPPRQTPEPPTV